MSGWHHCICICIFSAPTALALTTTLLSTSLPVAECKRHLAIFSSMTPVATLLSYAVLSLFGGSGGGWESVALLFSVRFAVVQIGVTPRNADALSIIGRDVPLRGDGVAANLGAGPRGGRR